MKISQRNLILGLLLVGAGSFWLGVSLVNSTEVRTGRSFGAVDEQRALAASGIEDVDLETVSADIVWHTDPGREIRARLHAPASPLPPELFVDRQGARAVIKVRQRPGISFSGFGPGRLVLDVYVPQRNWRSVTLRTVSGNLRAAGLSTSRAEVKTTSGWINLGQFRGDLDFSSVSGDLQVQYAAFDGNRAKLTSTSGRLNLDLPDSARFALDARSVSGDIRCTFPVTVSGGSTGGPGDHRLSGSVRGAGNTIEARTVSGDIGLF